MKRSFIALTFFICVVTANEAWSMYISTHYSPIAWSKDESALLIFVNSHGPEGGGSIDYILVDAKTHKGQLYAVSNTMSPGDGSTPESISNKEWRATEKRLRKDLKEKGFDEYYFVGDGHADNKLLKTPMTRAWTTEERGVVFDEILTNMIYLNTEAPLPASAEEQAKNSGRDQALQSLLRAYANTHNLNVDTNQISVYPSPNKTAYWVAWGFLNIDSQSPGPLVVEQLPNSYNLKIITIEYQTN